MIFVTVGTQLPFDRLIRYMDHIAPDLAEPVFAQTGTSSYSPKNIKSAPLITSADFAALMDNVSVIVGHAGIGTLIAAQKHHKPLVLVPRLAANAEHRNDHQVATVNSMRHRQGVYVAVSEKELRALLLRDLDPPDDSEALQSRNRLIFAVTHVIFS